ncbi:MAG: kynureninase [Planctomycetota bacterium]
MAEVLDHDLLETRAKALDVEDPLSLFRDRFHIPLHENGKPEIYFVGNSLGLQPKLTESYVVDELESWKTRGVRGHFEGEYPWMPYHEFLTEPMAKIVGALPEEVVMMNGLTANLHLMMATFYRPENKRTKILIEDHAFPSDHYAVESQIRWHGLDPRSELVVLSPDAGEETINQQKITQAIEYFQEELALVVLPGVQYYTGQVFDVASIVEVAHQYNIPVGIDLAHAAGNVELRLHDWNVDFAVWCSYKYLNSGPGSVAGCFVHQLHAKNPSKLRLAGWWGQDKESRFLMDNQFRAIPSAEGWQLSNPPILSMAAIRASLQLFEEAGIDRLIEKSKRLTGFFLECIDHLLGEDVTVITPREGNRRGCQLSLKVNLRGISGKVIFEQLEASGIRTDWREPDVIRAAPVPLYNQFIEVFEFTRRLKEILNATKSAK